MGERDVVVVAPHPDDETLGCAGVIMRARRAGARVQVLFLTNGDGFPAAAAALSGKEVPSLTPKDFLEVGRMRQQGALDAARILGLASQDLVFLGYPDGGLVRMPSGTSAPPFTQQHTRRDCTYGLMFPDHHTQMHGAPAPYVRAAAVSDVADLLRSYRPAHIYVTDADDGHPDHGAAFGLVHEATAVADFRGEFYTYLIHGSGGKWPWPRGATPNTPFEAHTEEGRQVPAAIAWPPDDRRPMTPEEAAMKLKAIEAYTLEIQLARHYVESFVKSEEIFWRRRV